MDIYTGLFYLLTGYKCQGNEWSAFMLLASHLVLNGQGGTCHTTIYPFAHQFSNQFSVDQQVGFG